MSKSDQKKKRQQPPPGHQTVAVSIVLIPGNPPTFDYIEATYDVRQAHVSKNKPVTWTLAGTTTIPFVIYFENSPVPSGKTVFPSNNQGEVTIRFKSAPGALYKYTVVVFTGPKPPLDDPSVIIDD